MTYIGKEPLPVFIGGTGVASTTAYAPLCGGTTTTSNLQAASTGISNSGYVLTSNGASALPSWVAPSNIGTVTQYDVLVGGASSAIASIGPGSAGQVLQSGGASANPAYSTATYPAVATGTGTILRANGTNWVATTATYPTTTTANQLLYSSSTSVIGEITGANNGVLITSNSGVPSLLANSATPGYVLTANSGAPPSWQAAAASLTGFTDGSSDYNTALGVGAAVATVGGGGVQNVALGYNTLHANTSGNRNIAVGYLALAASVTLSDNIAMGAAALTLLTTGAGNIGIGTGTLSSITSGGTNIGIGLANSNHITSGSNNIAIGYAAYSGSTPTGSQNVLIGTSAGNAYTGSESNNICLGYNVNGTTSESNVIRIGNGSAAACYINGIEGVSVANTNMVTINTSTGQLGSQAVPASLTGYTNSSGTYSTALGYQANPNNLGGDAVAIGHGALLVNTTGGNENTAVGVNALYSNTTGSSNTAAGQAAGQQVVTGNYNTFLGSQAGFRYTGSESANTIIGAYTQGVVGESNTIRIADATSSHAATTCFIGGISGVSVANTNMVTINTSTGQLGSQAVPVAGKAYFQAYPSSTISNVTGDGTNYTIVFDTAQLNVGSGYSTSTGIFTAPYTGVYQLGFTISINSANYTSMTYGQILTNYNGTNTPGPFFNPLSASATGGNLTYSDSWLWHLSSGDQVYLIIVLQTGAKTVSILGTGNPLNGNANSFFWGYQIA